MPLPDDFRGDGQQVIANLEAALAENPQDVPTAVKLHQAYIMFQQRDEALALAKLICKMYPGEADAQLYVAEWYQSLALRDELETCLRAAHEASPQEPRLAAKLARLELEQGRLDEAGVLLAPLNPPADYQQASALVALAGKYQQAERHEEAYALLAAVKDAMPRFLQNQQFCQMAKVSEKALGSPASLVPRPPFYRTNWFWTVAITGLLAAVLWGVPFQIARRRTLHVVNGLSQPLVVEVDGSRVEVPAGGREELVVAEGRHQAQLLEPSSLAEDAPVPFEVRTRWFERWIRKPVFALDPAGVSAVSWQEAVYVAAGQEAKAAHINADVRFHIGERLIAIPHADYHFRDFPDEIDLGERDWLKRSRVTLIDVDPLTLAMQDMLDPQSRISESWAAMDVAERWLRAEGSGPDGVNTQRYLVLARMRDELPRCCEFLGTRLTTRPVDTQWHRAYQSASDLVGQWESLRQRYDQLLQAAPDDSDLLYLRGRCEPDTARAEEFFERSLEADANNSFPLAAKAYTCLTRGEFAEAEQLIRRAQTAAPDRGDLKDTLHLTLLGQGKYLEVAKEFDSRFIARPPRFPEARQAVALRLALGDPEVADKILRQFKGATPPEESAWEWALDAEVLLQQQKYRELLELCQKHPEQQLTGYQFLAHLVAGDLERAAQSLVARAEAGQLDPDLTLALSIAHRLQDSPEAAQWLEAAATQLNRGPRASRVAAELLSNAADEGASRAARELLLEPDLKCLVLAALAIHHTDLPERDAVLDLAERLNFRFALTRHFLAQAIAQARQK